LAEIDLDGEQSPDWAATLEIIRYDVSGEVADEMVISILRPAGDPLPEVPVGTRTIGLDIKPGSHPNPVNPKSRGKIPVALLSDANFDSIAEVDIESLTFGHSGDETSLAFCGQRSEDANGDGLPDLICHFSTPAAAFLGGDEVGTLKGKTIRGVSIEGSDSVKITPK